MATYFTIYQQQRKINSNTTRLANVTVYDAKGKKIGCESVSKWQDKNEVANMIIRDFELSKIWNSKQFSFNQ